MVITAVGSVAFASLGAAQQGIAAVIVIGLIALGLLGPYSYLAGAMALDFGGRKGGATAAGLIDGVGYLGGILAGDTVARLATGLGWRTVFVLLAGVAASSAFAACALFIQQRRDIRTITAPDTLQSSTPAR
jgi:sugar phosphate permease